MRNILIIRTWAVYLNFTRCNPRYICIKKKKIISPRVFKNFPRYCGKISCTKYTVRKDFKTRLYKLITITILGRLCMRFCGRPSATFRYNNIMHIRRAMSSHCIIIYTPPRPYYFTSPRCLLWVYLYNNYYCKLLYG